MKKWIVFLSLALIVSNGYWLYVTMDDAVTLFYSADSIAFTGRALEETTRIANINVIGMSAEEALEKLNPTLQGLEPFEKEGCINVGTVCLALDESRIVVGVR